MFSLVEHSGRFQLSRDNKAPIGVTMSGDYATSIANDDGNRKEIVRALERGIDLLSILEVARKPLGLTELAERSGLTTGTVYRLLKALEKKGMVQQSSEDRRYRLGIRILELAQGLVEQHDLLAATTPWVRRIREFTGETVSVNVRAGNYRVAIYAQESPHQIRRSIEIGKPLGLYHGASGKLLLAALPDDEIDQVLSQVKLIPLAEKTITDRAALWDDIRRIRQLGYAESESERTVGALAFAAPIRDRTGSVVAALAINGLTMRCDSEEKRSQFVRLLMQASTAISEELGYREAASSVAKGEV